MWRISTALVVLFAASWAYADSPPTDRIIIDVITVNGTGCPAGTAAVSVLPDNTGFTLSYAAYTAQVGVGARSFDFRKNCDLNLLVHAPSGFSYVIASAEYRGFASLAAGAPGLVRGTLFFQGQSPRPFAELRLSGPFENDWAFIDSFDTTGTLSSCGAQRNLNIRTEVQVNAGTSDPTTTTSLVTMDSTDGAITQTYRFRWQRCL